MREELVLVARAIELEREQQAQRIAARHRQGQHIMPPGGSASSVSVMGMGGHGAAAAGMAAADADPTQGSGERIKLSSNLREQNEQLREFLSYFCSRYFPRPLPRGEATPEEEDQSGQGSPGRPKHKGKSPYARGGWGGPHILFPNRTEIFC